MKRLLMLISIILILCSNLTFAEDIKTGIETGMKALNFSLKTLEGKTVTLNEFIGNRKILLTFWATWCPSCIQEVSELKKIQETYKDKDLKIIAVNVGARETVAGIKKFIKDYEINYTVLYDELGSVSRSYKILGIPTNILIDKQGIIRHKGYSIPSDLDLALQPSFYSSKQKNKKGLWELFFAK